MTFNSFQTNILARILLLVANLMLFSFLMIRQERFFTILFLALTAVVQIVLLFVYLNRTNRNLARFLLLLTHENTSVIHWKDKVEKTFRGLHHSFKKVNDEINRIRIEKEKGSILLRGIIEHVETGILVAEDNGQVELANAALLRTLGLTRIGHLKELDHLSPGLSGRLSGLKYDSGNVLPLGQEGQETSHLLVRVSRLRLEERNLNIYSLQDIGTQLEANEIESWQKMTRVLAHEIANSVTPISTLGDGIRLKMKQGKEDEAGRLVLNPDTARDLSQSAELIRHRSDALVEFMETYKQFSKLPDPVPKPVRLVDFLEGLELLFREDLKDTGIRLEREVSDEELSVHADPKLLEQAFINLLRNSINALKGRTGGLIRILAGKEKERLVHIDIWDNGCGIPEDVLPQVFTPFFTTRKGGTGIGMTLVRKIVVMSGGSISLESEVGIGTKVTIRLMRNM